MSNQPEPTFSSTGGNQPMTGAGQSPKNNSNQKIIIGVVIAALVLCCVCVTIAGLGAAAFFYIHKAANIEPTPEIIEPTQSQEISATPDINSPTETAVPETPTSGQGLGITRDAMLQFFTKDDTFQFGQPTQVQGQEVVQGENKSLCIDTNCAAVTMVGPADDLLDVSEYVPTDPADSTQTTIALTALIDAASQFTGSKSATPLIIMGELIQAQSEGKDFQKTIQENGYSFLEDYNAQTHNAGITITRAK